MNHFFTSFAHRVEVGLRMLLVCWLWMIPIQSTFAATPPNKSVLVAVDVSSSTRTHRADYIKYFRMILDAMGERDVLLVTKITKHPSAGESLAFPPVKYAEGSQFTLLDNRQKIKEANLKIREANLKRSLDALKLFETLIKDDVDETPIIEVTQNSQRLLQQFKADRQIIVYLSDMMEYSSSTANFESTKLPFSTKLAEIALAKVKKDGRVASLKGVKIYVAGARDADAKRKEAVKWFWTEYFKESGAALSVNDYGPDLVSFEECNSPGSCGTIFAQERDKRMAK